MNKATLATTVRAVLKIGGGWLVAKGLADDGQVEELAGAIAALIGIVWGIWEAKKAKAAKEVVK